MKDINRCEPNSLKNLPATSALPEYLNSYQITAGIFNNLSFEGCCGVATHKFPTAPQCLFVSPLVSEWMKEVVKLLRRVSFLLVPKY